MKEFNTGTKAGLGMMLAAGIIMGVLVLLSKPVPDLAAWIFFAGFAVSIVSALLIGKRPK